MRFFGPALLVAVSLGSAVPLMAGESPATPARRDHSLIEEPAIALRRLAVAPGLQVDLFAAEPDVRNAVALSIDEHGRVFVVESDRRRSSVFDIRGHPDWLDADFSFRTVRERAEFLRRELAPNHPAVLERLAKGGRGDFGDFNQDGFLDWRDLEVQSERIRLLEDTDGDGRADRVSVFADGFTNIAAGVAAGVLARRGDIYFACIPDLWRRPDYEATLARDRNPPAPPTPSPVNRKSDFVNLLTGFGVHIAFGGHDMHGLIFGPDGKLYWSIADRGTDTNLFARIQHPIPGLTPELLADSGCIFRANPDGTDFEVMAWGLRNPQELAFDEWGNLFTADNNGDGGDKARWHYVVDGADFGWRIGWQWLEARAYQPKMGPWNGERLWHLGESNTAAWLLPPLAHIGHGPAGLVYNPGTGLPPRFNRHFFLCDFPGHVLMWTNIPAGASFRTGPVQNFFGELGPTDIAFHPNGGVLISDWFKTFDKTDKGRIYRIHDPATDASAAVQETRKQLRRAMPSGASLEFIAQGFRRPQLAPGANPRSEQEAIALLSHTDARVREDALAEAIHHDINVSLKGLRQGERPLRNVLRTSEMVQARLMALRGLERVGRVFRPGFERLLADAAPFIEALADPAAEVRAQSVRALASLEITSAIPRITILLNDPDARVRFFAAQSLGALRAPVATAPLLEFLRANADQDLYLRHAAVVALARLADTNALLQTIYAPGNEKPRAVRMGAVLTLRRLASPEVARFLSDPDPLIVLEAARAIHDASIEPALPRLAALVPGRANDSSLSPFSEETYRFLLRRALNANFRIGQATHAQALSVFAALTNAPTSLRIEALELLALWPKPPGRDHFMGLWRPLPPRAAGPAADALRPALASLLGDASKDVRLATVRAALAVSDFDSFTVFADASQPSVVRVEALKSMAQRKHQRLPEALAVAAQASSEALRVEAVRLQGDGVDLAHLGRTLETGTLPEKQNALMALATTRTPVATGWIARELDALIAGQLARELALDVLEAAAAAKDSALRDRLTLYTNSLPKDDALAVWRPVLQGGNATAGRATFYDNQQIACFRCHKLNGEGGEVGPELTGLTAQRGREYLLESIVYPNKVIAPGFESALITMKNGTEYAGTIKAETPDTVELHSLEDGVLKLKQADIAERRRSLSAMPEELVAVLSPRELRDLIEFLAQP